MAKNYVVFLFVSIPFFFGFKNESSNSTILSFSKFTKKETPKKILFSNNYFPSISDSLLTNKCHTTDTYSLAYGDHYLMYVGPIRKHATVNKPINSKHIIPNERFYHERSFASMRAEFGSSIQDWISRRTYQYVDSGSLKILVDTSSRVSNKNRLAYPVYIVNLKKDTLTIGSGNSVPVFCEALDSSGNWKRIECQALFECGMGIPRIILRPKNMLITSQLIFSGTTKTKFRLSCRGNSSNEFYGYINPSQFKE
jgi:hypothetical protein